MGDDRVVSLGRQSRIEDALTELLREKASELLQAAVHAECEEFLARLPDRRDDQGRQGVVRNGYLPEREVLTGIGPVAVKVPRVRDRTRGPAPVRIEAGPDLRAHGLPRSMRCCRGCTCAGSRRPRSARRSRRWWAQRQRTCRHR